MCSPQCPVVRAQLREIVREAPWLVQKDETKAKQDDAKRSVTYEEGLSQESPVLVSAREDAIPKRKEIEKHVDPRLSKHSQTVYPLQFSTPKSGKPIQRDQSKKEPVSETYDTVTPRSQVADRKSEKILLEEKSLSETQDPVALRSEKTLTEETLSEYRGASVSRSAQKSQRFTPKRESGTDSYDAVASTSDDKFQVSSRRGERVSKFRDTVVSKSGHGSQKSALGAAPEFELAELAFKEEGISDVDARSQTFAMEREDQRSQAADIKSAASMAVPPTATASTITAAQLAEYQSRGVQGMPEDGQVGRHGCSYFDNVCTCCLDCVVRSLAADSFVQGLLTSVALFSIGLKLCSELNFWYIPSPIS